MDDDLGTPLCASTVSRGDVRKLGLTEKEVGLLLFIGDPIRGLGSLYKEMYKHCTFMNNNSRVYCLFKKKMKGVGPMALGRLRQKDELM